MKRLLILTPLLGMAVTTSAAQWRSFAYNADNLTGKIDAHGASSPFATSRDLVSPYEGTRGRIYYQCNVDGGEFAFLRFTKQPNLTDGSYGSGNYKNHNVRAAWDGQVTAIPMSQAFGSNDMDFQSSSAIIDSLLAKNTFAVELRWYGAGRVAFRFTLRGSTAAIEQARKKCGYYEREQRMAEQNERVAKQNEHHSMPGGWKRSGELIESDQLDLLGPSGFPTGTHASLAYLCYAGNFAVRLNPPPAVHAVSSIEVSWGQEEGQRLTVATPQGAPKDEIRFGRARSVELYGRIRNTPQVTVHIIAKLTAATNKQRVYTFTVGSGGLPEYNFLLGCRG